MGPAISERSIMSAKNERSRVGRPSGACLQCQRRKQKCSRKWPCSNCQSRKVAHLCGFSCHTSQNPHETTSEVSSPKKREHHIAPTERRSSDFDDLPKGPMNTLKVMGYMEVAGLNEFQFQQHRSKTDIAVGLEPYPREINEALNSIPPKTQADILIRHALDKVDYVRVTFYPNQILDQYEAWWFTPKKQKSLNFTSVILRLCSLGLQYLPAHLRKHIENELGDDVQYLTERYHNAAKQLSDYSDPGTGDLTHVQQQFLTAAWLKGEGCYMKAWHCLGAAIREAQELGIHQEVAEDFISDMDRELRRRIWCSLYTWDRFMSIILCRPYLIDEGSCTVQLPSPNLEMDRDQPDIPSPVVWQLLKYKGAQITVEISSLKNKTDVEAVSALLQKLYEVQDSVPAPFRFDYTSPSLDDQYSQLSFAKHKILLDIYVSFFMLLKPFLFVNSSGPEGAENRHHIGTYRKMACDYSLLLIELVARMEALFCPERAKDHQIAFTPFDTAMTLCIVLQKDLKKNLLPRKDIVKAIGTALHTLSRMENFSSIARQGVMVLKELVGSLSLTLQEKDIILIQPREELSQLRVLQLGVLGAAGAISDSNSCEAPNRAFQAVDGQTSALNIELPATNGEESFQNESLDLFAQPLDLEWRDDIDLGILDEVFHWDNLGI